MKHRDNYEYMKEKMQQQFLKHDQAVMIRKSGLRHDAQYLYLECLERAYRISRTNGVVDWTEDGFATCCTTNYNEAMSIYDVLCCSKDNCGLSERHSVIQKSAPRIPSPAAPCAKDDRGGVSHSWPCSPESAGRPVRSARGLQMRRAFRRGSTT